MQAWFRGREKPQIPGTTNPVIAKSRPWVVIRSSLVLLEGEGRKN